MVGTDVAPVLTSREDVPEWVTRCLNCHALLTGRFCANCGQRAVPPHPTARELAGDAIAELSGWDGKLVRTLHALILRPGELTRAVVTGQRARYVSPVRVYLTCSLLYFLFAALAPLPPVEAEFDVGVGVGAGESTPGERALAKAMLNGLGALTPEERADADGEIASQPWIVRPMLRAMAEDFRGVRQRAIAVMPRALFVLIPALAAILMVFHRGKPFPDHLYFAVHLQAFVFLALSLVTLAQSAKSLVVLGLVQLAMGAVILWYAMVAQRRVYGGTWPATALKTTGVGVIYLTLWGTSSMIATLWVSRGA